MGENMHVVPSGRERSSRSMCDADSQNELELPLFIMLSCIAFDSPLSNIQQIVMIMYKRMNLNNVI